MTINEKRKELKAKAKEIFKLPYDKQKLQVGELLGITYALKTLEEIDRLEGADKIEKIMNTYMKNPNVPTPFLDKYKKLGVTFELNTARGKAYMIGYEVQPEYVKEQIKNDEFELINELKKQRGIDIILL